jgi:hypothetical protein
MGNVLPKGLGRLSSRLKMASRSWRGWGCCGPYFVTVTVLREVVVGLASAPRVALAIASREHGVIRRSRTTTTRMRWYAGGAEADIKVGGQRQRD